MPNEPQHKLIISKEAQIIATLSRGYVLSRAIYTVALLKIADEIDETPTHIDIIATHTGTKAAYLLRLLRFLAAYGIFKEETPEAFVETPLSKPLKSESSDSMRDILCMVDCDWWAAMGAMDHCLTEGGAAYEHLHESPFFTHLSQTPTQQKRFDEGMARFSVYTDHAIVRAYDFSKMHHIVDLGGGRGGFLGEVLKECPDLKATLFERCAALTNQDLGLSQLYPNRFTAIAGDFFESIPKDADLYFLQGVLHDFNETDTLKILATCKKCMPASARLLIAEQVIPETPEPHPNKTMDIVMMVLLDGQQRTLEAWSVLLQKSGFTLTQTLPTESLFTLLECVPNFP